MPSSGAAIVPVNRCLACEQARILCGSHHPRAELALIRDATFDIRPALLARFMNYRWS
jgi:hypothetical protein